MKWYKIAKENWEEIAEITTNPNILRELLENERKYNANIFFTAASNPNCPQDILRKILERGKNDIISRCAAANTNCPPDALKMVLERDKNDEVSYCATENLNCPPDALRMVLERGNNDWMSECAASNPNCPPDVLKMVLERGNNDIVSQNAAQNPNCPPDALKMVLERGKDDDLSLCVAKNLNCPPELLKMVLERGNNNEVSSNAARNPNCPLLSKIQWMRATGKIGKEDPSKHFIEYDEPKVDKDLQELREIRKKMSKTNNWYKIAQEIYRGDPTPINMEDFNPEYGTKQLGKELGSSAAWGPGIYFVTAKDIAEMYGSNLTKKNLHNAKILTMQNPLFNYQQINKILQGVDKNTMDLAISNWDENYSKGKRMLIESVTDAEDPLNQLMNIWSEVYSHQKPHAFIELMLKNGIDGISISRDNAIYYVIYNKNILK